MTSHTGIQILQDQATSLYKSGHLRQALHVCREILELQPDRADVLSFAGLIALELDEYGAAVALYRAAVARRPEYAEAHYNLGNALRGLGMLEEAISAYRRATEIRPKFAPAHGNLGNLLQSVGRLYEALQAYERALAAMPYSSALHRNIGIALQKLGRLGEAVAAYRRALDLKPAWLPVYNNLVTALLEQGDAGAALDACNDWLKHHPCDRGALAYKSVAFNELGDREALRVLIDFDRFLRTTQVTAPAGFATLAEFNRALARHVCNHPTLRTPPEDDPTYHHPSLQITDELLVDPKGPVAALEAIMNRAVIDYLDDLPADPTHPFLANPPHGWRLASWAAVLNGQGNLVPHIHKDGYLSGVYYVQLPTVVSAPGQGQAGWFELGRSPSELCCRAEPIVRAIQPKEGMMLLFPAYFFHQTLPFESTQQRISIAFDVVPV